MGKSGLGLVALLVINVLVGAITISGSWTPRDDTLVYRFKTDAPTLDPAYGRDTTSSTVLQCLFDGLTELDAETLEVKPELAESWEVSDDGTVYTFHLRHGVEFHNGREVTAEDFKFSMERVLDPATAADQRWVLEELKGADTFDGKTVQHVEGIEVLDPYTLRLTINRPYAPFLALLSMEAASPVPREEVERLGEDFAIRPTGCGPYRFVSWTHDATIVL
jgi:oligopeptide transport system substrate-binding protein